MYTVMDPITAAFVEQSRDSKLAYFQNHIDTAKALQSLDEAPSR